MNKNELVHYVWAEYALNVQPSKLAHLLDTPIVQNAASKARCNVHITRRVLNKRQQTSQWIRYSIVRITGPDDQAINQCNRSLERAVPLYQKRKEYTRRAPVTLYSRNLEARGDFWPKTADVVFRKKFTSSRWATTGIASTRSVGLFRGKQNSVTADLNTQMPTSFTSAPLSATIRTNLNALDDSQSENTADMLGHLLPTPTSTSSSPSSHSHATQGNGEATLRSVHSVNPSKCSDASITAIEPGQDTRSKAMGKYNDVRSRVLSADGHLDECIPTFNNVLEAKTTDHEEMGPSVNYASGHAFPAWLSSSAKFPEVVNVSPVPGLTLTVSDSMIFKDDVSVQEPFSSQVTNLSANRNDRLPLNNLAESFQFGGAPPSGLTTEQAKVVTEQNDVEAPIASVKEKHLEMSTCVANELSTTQEIKLDRITTGAIDITRKMEQPFEVNETADLPSSRCDLNDEAIDVSTTTKFCVTTVIERSHSSVGAPISGHVNEDTPMNTNDMERGTDEIPRMINSVEYREHTSCGGTTAKSKPLIVSTSQKQGPCSQHFIWKHSEEGTIAQSPDSDNSVSRNELSSPTSVLKSEEAPGIRGVDTSDPHMSTPLAVGYPSPEVLNPRGRSDFTNRRASPRAPCEPLSNLRSSLAGDDNRSKSPLGTQATRPLSSSTSISSYLGLQVNRVTGDLELSFGVSGTPFLATDLNGQAPAFDPSLSVQWDVKLERNLLFGLLGSMTPPVPH